MDELFEEHELILLPAAPVATLEGGADHSQTRKRLLRYTAPFSMAGAPAATIPCEPGGVQIGAARERDESLLQLVALLAARRKASAHVANS
jgi:aspartyl-tRNA(Asn)/glutamyl-tRNA(Gln) amidotransferase subunit A